MDIDSVTADVALAVGLAEGPSGVSDVLRAIARSEPVAVRDVSRMAELPVPIVAAVCNELRQRARPARRADRADRPAGAGGGRGSRSQAGAGPDALHGRHEDPAGAADA